MEIAIFIVVALLIAAGAAYSYFEGERRRKALVALALRNGWHFSSAKDYGMEGRYPAFSCLRQGSRRYAFNLLTGQRGDCALCGFDYHYETYSTDSKGNRTTHHHYFSAVVYDAGLPLQPLALRPEGVFDKVAQWFGYDDINFESDQFSREFHVRADDPRWAFDVLHQATIEFLLHAPRFNVEFAGRHVIAYRKSRLSADDFERAVQVVGGIIDRLPRYLLRELKGVD